MLWLLQLSFRFFFIVVSTVVVLIVASGCCGCVCGCFFTLSPYTKVQGSSLPADVITCCAVISACESFGLAKHLVFEVYPRGPITHIVGY